MRIPGSIASIVLLALWLLPAAAWAEDGPSVSLQSLLEAGKQNHPTLAKKPLLKESLELQHSKMNRAYWPQLSFGGQATWQSDVTSVDVPIPGVTIDPPPQDQYKFTLDLHQSIWDGGVTSDQKRVAESRVRVEQEKVEAEWRQVRERIVQLYFAGVVQQELEAQAEVLHRYLGTVVEKAQLSLANGVATERDVLLAQARQLEARQAIADAKAHIAGIRRSLQDLTGMTLAGNTKFTIPLETCSAGRTEALAEQDVKRPELSILAAQADLLEAQQDAQDSVDLPKLGLFATGGYARPGLNFLSNDFSFYFIGGVQLTVPLTYLYAGTWSNGSEQLEVQRSILAREREAVLRQINVQADTQNAELARFDAAIALDEELLKVRERVRTHTERQLKLGTATMTDLINDLTQEDQARSRRTVHRVQRSLACHELELIKGDL